MSDYSSVAPPQSQQNFSQSSAFAAALQRAKQIAAKIQPTGQGSKRPLEDPIDSESKKFGGSEYSSPQSSSGMSPAAMQAAVQAAAVAARLAQCNTTNTIVNEDIRVPDKMVGLIIGRGGEQITRLQSETSCKIQMAADSGGTPDRICSLSGSREAVNRARELVSKIVSQHGNATIDIISSTTVPNPTAAANNQGGGFSSGNSNNSVGSNGGGSNTSANGERREGGNGAGAGNGGNSSGYGGSQYEEIMIPGPKVGLVIGKGGETIKQLQEKTGAKMVVIQDGPSQELEKPLRISGDPQKVEHAKQLVYELIQEKDPFYNRGYNEGDQAEVFVPKAAVGVVIGKGGDMIKKIQGETGCKLQFIQGRGDGPGDRRCIIQGTQQQVDDAKQIIEDLIESVMRREGGNGAGGAGGAGNMNRNNGNNFCGEMGYPNQQMREDVSFVVPASKCGIIIGRGGETIKQINQQSGAYCEMDRKTQNSLTEKAFTIKGTSEQIEHARRIISDKIGLQIKIIGGSGGNGSMGDGNNGQYNMQGGNNGGNTPNSYPQQWGYTPQTWEQTQQQQQQQQQNVQVNPSTGQPDYSAQWIDYYRSMGLHREAEMIEQQLKAKQTGQPSGGQSIVPNSNQSNGVVQSGQMPGQPQSGPMQGNMNSGQQQPDYSAQWAEYYRSIGKNEEADAIDNQIKATKQTGPMGPQGGPVPSMPGYSMPGGPGGPQGMMPGGYAQYPQFYTGAGGAGGQPGGQGGAAGQPGAYGQNFGAYGGYPGPGGAGGGGAGGAPGPGPNQQASSSQNASNDKN